MIWQKQEQTESFYPVIRKFIEQADAAKSLKVNDYPKFFEGLEVKVSFGQGGYAHIPWISFLYDGQTTSKGIYPVFLYFKKQERLILAYGISETNEHLDWILKNRLYNIRTDHVRGALKLSPETIAAKYLLLHTSNMSITNLIYCLDVGGPRVVSDKHLIKLGYPSKLTCPYYIGYTLQSSKSVNEEFGLTQWDIRKLSNYQSGFKAAYPFTVTLEELMGCKCDK